MKKKKILLQCQGLLYFYMGLASIFTMHSKEDIEIDILISAMWDSPFIDIIRKNKYVNNVHIIKYRFPNKYKKLFTIKNNLLNKIKYYFRYKSKLIKSIKNEINIQSNLNEDYSEVYFSLEQSLLITSLKLVYPNATFNTYGDGPGMVIGTNSRLIYKDKKFLNFKFFKEIKPDNIVALLPYRQDKSMDIENVPIIATDKNILKEIILEDNEVQKKVIDFKNELNQKFPEKKKNILLMTALSDKRYDVSIENQVKLYLEIVYKYCSEGSICVLKCHPTCGNELFEKIKMTNNKNITLLKLPDSMSVYPVESLYELIKDFDNVMTFISSAYVMLKYLYNIDCISSVNELEKYTGKNYVLDFVKEQYSILERIEGWDRKSLIVDSV